jgi:hypothetical protein
VGSPGAGATAATWAAAKAAFGLATAPVAVPALTAAALHTAQRTGERIELYPAHLRALIDRTAAPLPGTRTVQRDAGERYLITSDLHRCVPGRLDWPARQGVKDLYAQVLAGYADQRWHLIENGDVEDFWMVGGSTWGAVYDMAYLGGSFAGPARRRVQRRVLREHLDRIVANNRAIYDVVADGFCASGRYHRTMGNHDDVFDDPMLVDALAQHLPGIEMADTILLTRDGAAPDGVGDVDAIVAHGHLTDSWNGHGFAALGRYLTWAITGLDDLPGLPNVDPLPDGASLQRLLERGVPNRLISVDPRYGGNRRFDSLDEERLFARLSRDAPDGGWPWLLFGHTHFPMLRPLDAAGHPVRYANSGSGVLHGAFTALEWDPTSADGPLHLVIWQQTPDGPRRTELVPDGPTLRALD